MDPTEYLLAVRAGLRVETTLGPGWATHEVALRIVMRCGGQLQPAVPTKIDATNTATLEAR